MEAPLIISVEYLIIFDILCIDSGPVEGENNFVGESAIVESVQVDELNVWKWLVAFGDAAAAFPAMNAAGEVKQGSIPAS